MVSYPAAIPIASAVAAPSPSSLNSKAGSGTTRGSVVATAQPEKDQEDEQEAAVPPPLDPALLTAPSTTINHLCSARLRLMTSLPSVGIAWSLWCGQCGALRDADTSSRPKKRSSDGVIKEDDGNC